jgi:carbonic anhydrase/acetyltransferase-like protein (isoleucine patch superfamily)
VTWHALEETQVETGDRGSFGVHSVIHGGPSSFGPHTHETAAGDDVVLKDQAVLFNAVVGDDVTIGVKSLVQNSELASGTEVPDRVVILNDAPPYPVEW